jgi:hypothetical protein
VKNYTPLFLVIASIYSFGCFAQDNRDLASAKKGNVTITSEKTSDNELVIVSYRVEERVIMNFGSYITTYNVANLSLVRNSETGPNNTRVITPIYGKVKTRDKVVEVEALAAKINEPTKVPLKITPPTIEPVVDAVAPERKNGTANVDILKTYERVLEKGYKSVDMLKKVGNGRFFNGDLVIAAKWYTQLFEQATDLEAVYYYRYAESLKAIKQIDKANEMMAIFKRKNL